MSAPMGPGIPTEPRRPQSFAEAMQRLDDELRRDVRLPDALRHAVGVDDHGETTTSWEVVCADKGVRHTGPFREEGRAQHWRQQADAVCCSSVPHIVVAVVTDRAVQATGVRP